MISWANAQHLRALLSYAMMPCFEAFMKCYKRRKANRFGSRAKYTQEAAKMREIPGKIGKSLAVLLYGGKKRQN